MRYKIYKMNFMGSRYKYTIFCEIKFITKTILNLLNMLLYYNYKNENKSMQNAYSIKHATASVYLITVFKHLSQKLCVRYIFYLSVYKYLLGLWLGDLPQITSNYV